MQKGYKGGSLVNDFTENSKEAYEYLVSKNSKVEKKKGDGPEKKKLLTRTGSDPKFDNIEYL